MEAQPITMLQAVDMAQQHYPSVQVSAARVNAAAAAIELARTAYLPRIDSVAGINRATHNNVFGLLLPSQVIAPISGPVLNTNSLSHVWGSTVGVLATWEPFDFGYRDANVALASLARERSAIAGQRTRFDVGVIAADTFLTVLAARQTVAAAEAGVRRASEFLRVAEALVTSGLRPETESALARAESGAAQIQLVRARQAEAEALATLGTLLGPQMLQAQIADLLRLPPDTPDQSSLETSPAAREQNAAVSEAEARLHVVKRSGYPKFALQGTTYARGTGVYPDGATLGGISGLGPNTQNWAVGFTGTFPVFEIFALRARRAIESANVEAERSRYSQVLADLGSARAAALARLEGARQIAATTPEIVQTLQIALRQGRARYQAGLGNVLDVVELQRRLTQAEIEDRLARLGIWRALLSLQAAQGDIRPLLAEASR